MPLNELVQVCRPPLVAARPPEAEAWRNLETLIGSQLPSDYKALIELYGSGGFGSDAEDGTFFDLAFMLSPSQPADSHGLNAIPLMSDLTSILRDIRHRFPDAVPHPVWPEASGLLYAGGTTTRNGFYWKTDGAPSAPGSNSRSDGDRDRGPRSDADFRDAP
jgi:hypothetical protein